jgi:isochorismate synthase EntC
MRLPVAVINTLMRGEDIQLCDSCGRYLYLLEGEGPSPELLTVVKKPAVQEKPAAGKARKRKTPKQDA